MKKVIIIFVCILGPYTILCQDLALSMDGKNVQGENITSNDLEIDINNLSFAELLSYGKMFEKGDNLEEALKFFSLAIKQNKKAAVAYDHRGVVYTKMEEFGNARRDLTKAIKLEPDYPEAYNHRGIANFYCNHLVVAINDYSMAIELDPRFSKAYYNRGLCYIRLDKIELAYLDLKKADFLGHPKADEMIWNYCTDQLFKVPKAD